MIEVVFGGVIEWVKTAEGAKFFGDLLGFDIQEGRSDTEYIVMDGFGRERTVTPEQVLFLGAAVINGEPMSMRLVRQNELPVKQCDLCGLESHCVKPVKNEETHETVLACNNCLVHNDITSLRNEGDSGMCHDCVKIECPVHPMKNILAGEA